MVKSASWPLHIIITLTLLIVNSVANAQAVAQVDRTVVAVDESLTLTLRVNRTGSISSPDLSAIRSNFHIVNNSQSTNHTYINGVSESVTQWQITLIPKQTGQLLIPAITIDGEKTLPIEIEVRPSAPLSQNNLLPVYLESEVESNNIYVQQQLIYTLRIFQSIQLDNMNISEPEFDQAAIKKLSQNSYQRRIKNTPYRVHELRYAIFPQQSGELIIPEAVFSANEVVSRRSVFSLPGQGKAIRKMSKQHTVTVKDAPSQFKGSTWLPAKSIQLEQTWSSNTDNIRVGESITRNITIKAEGLLDSQLPPITIPVIEGAKFYPDKGQTQSSETDQGVNSSRTDSTALIPTREGSLTLPEIRLTWWDTSNNKMREAHIPQSTLTVKPALNNTVQAPPAIDHSQTATIANSPVSIVTTSNTLYWQIACALLALAWLITLFLWLSLKQKHSVKHENHTLTTTPNPTEKQAYKALAAVCHNNNINESRQAIIQWAQTYWPQETIHSLQDVQTHCHHDNLKNALLQLDTYLYGSHNDSSEWNGENLLTVVNSIRGEHKKQKGTTNLTLAPLYPN